MIAKAIFLTTGLGAIVEVKITTIAIVDTKFYAVIDQILILKFSRPGVDIMRMS